MIKACDFLQDDNFSKCDLLNNIEIKKTTFKDFKEIAILLQKAFNLKSLEDSVRQLIYSQINLDISFKLVNKINNKIYGMLLFSNNDINNGIPMFMIKQPHLSNYLKNFKIINGFAFIIDKRLRNCGIDKKMLNISSNELLDYDFIWCGVQQNLKSHNYWKKIGFKKFFNYMDIDFYLRKVNNNSLIDIFILKILDKIYEKNID